MKKVILLSAISAFLICCNNNKQKVTEKDNRIYLRTDTLNVVKLTDTLVIYESVCRGCAYEGSTYFSINDSMGNIVLQEVITKDNHSPDVAGGNISKILILTASTIGKSSFKLYKFTNGLPTEKDSAIFTRYNVEVKN